MTTSNKQLKIKVTVKKDRVNACFEFAENIYHSKATSMKNHGNTGVKMRSKHDFIADIVRGKIAEFAFQKFLEENYDISFEVDVNVYQGEHNHDNGNDLATVLIEGEKRAFQYKIDIKGLNLKGHWLLVEDHKFWAQMYVVCRLHNIEDAAEFEKNPYMFKDTEFNVSILGYCMNKHLYDVSTNQAWFIFRQGQRLYSSKVIDSFKPNEVLRNPPKAFYEKLSNQIQNLSIRERFIGPNLISNINYGLPVKWLSNDWNNFVAIIKRYSTVSV